MSKFNAEWLRLREAADDRARTDHLVALLHSAWPGRNRSVVDLGAGTGANLRYLAPRLGPRQRWRCVDHDPALLEKLQSITADWARSRGYQVQPERGHFRISGTDWNALVVTEQRDLGIDVESLPLPAKGLVTASALLDLVSENWLRRIVDRGRAAECSLLFALSYDGRAQLLPANPDDQRVVALVNRHQRRDKGIGFALGPDASAAAERIATQAGYRVTAAPSNWRIDARERSLQKGLIDGWVTAARQLADMSPTQLAAWQAERQRTIENGRLVIEVGHRDLLALGPG